MSTPVRQPPEALPCLNLSGYRFVPLVDLPARRDALFERLDVLGMLGTVLLAPEGINIAVAGTVDAGRELRDWLSADPAYRDLWLKESRSEHMPFRRLKVRIRPEIITFDRSAPETTTEPPHASSGPTAPALTPSTLRDWLDHGRADGQRPLLLDTRNRYESDAGRFAAGPHHDTRELDIDHFTEFKRAIGESLAQGSLDRDRPVVTYCTGGVRCEKAAPWLLDQGFTEVWQLDGGILNWFARCDGEHWQGDCFVFDDRVTIDSTGQPTGASLCIDCQRVIAAGADCGCGARHEPSRTAIETV